jgi:hypothetical protein
MIYNVERYEHPIIVVRSAKTGLAHEYTVSEDGALYHDGSQFDLCDARDAATAYLTYFKNADANLAAKLLGSERVLGRDKPLSKISAKNDDH